MRKSASGIPPVEAGDEERSACPTIERIDANIAGADAGSSARNEALRLQQEQLDIAKQELDELRESNRNMEDIIRQGEQLRGIREVVRKVGDLARIRH